MTDEAKSEPPTMAEILLPTILKLFESNLRMLVALLVGKRRGRKRKNEKLDTEIAALWATGQYASYDAIGTKLSLPANIVKKSIERTRKRPVSAPIPLGPEAVRIAACAHRLGITVNEAEIICNAAHLLNLDLEHFIGEIEQLRSKPRSPGTRRN